MEGREDGIKGMMVVLKELGMRWQTSLSKIEEKIGWQIFISGETGIVQKFSYIL